jgi:periplasmic protein TonB
MFADSLLESPLAERSRRGWTTLVSFAGQLLGLGILLTLPLLYTEGLPTLKLIASGAPLSAPPEPPTVTRERPATDSRNSGQPGPIIVVRRDFHPTGLPPADPAGTELPACATCVPGDTTPGSIPGIPFSIGSTLPTLPARPVPPVKKVIVSRMMEGNLIYQVQPVYPPLARSARVQGTVTLRAVISRNGTIQNLQVLSGHPLLVRAAKDAVQQWRYRPYILNGEPMEVETQVTVNFLLSGN